MATTQALASSEPSAATVTDIYTGAALKLTTVRVLVANKGAAPLKYRLSIAPLGAADADSQYFVYDETLDANGSVSSPPLVLAPTDVVRAYTDIATLIVTVIGIQVDA
jgi:hypothetical protein